MPTTMSTAVPAAIGALALALLWGWTATAAADGRVNCADLGNRVDFTLRANLEITEHGSKCLITGRVRGNVTVRDFSRACEPPPIGVGQQAAELTAVNVIGGTIDGNVLSFGRRCAMVWLRERATVAGNVTHFAGGNLGFLDAPGFAVHAGSTVHGNVILGNGLLWATSTATDNRVDRHIICVAGVPRGPSGTGERGSGSRTDWDGADGDVDGTIGGHYLGC